MAHCCVIGGTGFIGSHIVDILAAKGKRVTVIGRNRTPSRVLPKSVQYIPADFSNPDFMRSVLQDVDEIIDLAYSTIPKTSFEDPVHDILANLPSAVHLFEVASSLNIRKLVLVSSGGTVYGKAESLPIREDHPTNPISPYGITKLACEKYALMYRELKQLPVVFVRPGNPFGEGQLPFAGQGFVATAIGSVLRNQEIFLFGSKGTTRDYIYVKDVASGIIAALEQGSPGSCYNIGSGTGRCNKDILDEIYPLAMAAGFEPKIKVLPPRDFDVPVNILDSTKLTAETDWRPTVSFEEGLNRTWDWLYNQHNQSGQSSNYL